jgi:hypothetical protein
MRVSDTVFVAINRNGAMVYSLTSWNFSGEHLKKSRETEDICGDLVADSFC